MNNRIRDWLIRCYPSTWRLEYGAEMEHLLHREPLSLSSICNVLWGALKEHARQPATRFAVSSGLVAAGLFTLSVLCNHLLWQLVAAPVTQGLRDLSINPPNLVATSPWDQALVIWLGIPFLFTLFAAYPLSLLFACRAFSISRQLKPIAAYSAMLYAGGVAGGLAAWHLGSFEILLRLLREVQKTPMVSVTQCFVLLAASTLGVAILLQVPLVVMHSLRAKTKGLLKG